MARNESSCLRNERDDLKRQLEIVVMEKSKLMQEIKQTEGRN
jgi:hypothetical protein